MFINPYDTTFGRLQNMTQLRHQLEDHLIKNPIGGQIIRMDQSVNVGSLSVGAVPELYGLFNGNSTFPQFAHPLDFQVNEKKAYIVDLRTFTKLSSYKTHVTADESGYNFTIVRGLLQCMWSSVSAETLLGFGDLPSIVFGQWISNMLRRRLGLEPDIHTFTQIIAMYYWYQLFNELDKEYTERELVNISRQIASATFIPETQVHATLVSAPAMRSLEDMLEHLKLQSGSVRFHNVTPAGMNEISGGSWFGLTGRQIVSVAFEHPPTFIAMLYAGLQTRGYQKTQIGELGKSYKSGRLGAEFISNVSQTLRYSEM